MYYFIYIEYVEAAHTNPCFSLFQAELVWDIKFEMNWQGFVANVFKI